MKPVKRRFTLRSWLRVRACEARDKGGGGLQRAESCYLWVIVGSAQERVAGELSLVDGDPIPTF